MDVEDMEIETTDMIASLLNVAAYIISPILFIWAVNTLFGTEIAMTFKTWLAGFVIILLIKFHLRFSGRPQVAYDESYDMPEDCEDEFWLGDEESCKDPKDPDDQNNQLKAKLISYRNHKNKRKSSSDES